MCILRAKYRSRGITGADYYGKNNSMLYHYDLYFISYYCHNSSGKHFSIWSFKEFVNLSHSRYKQTSHEIPSIMNELEADWTFEFFIIN
jgi:hypothetical protein